MSRWTIAIIILIVAGAGIIFGIGQVRERAESQPYTFRVAASFYPLAEFARQIGGDFVNVQQVVPAGVEAHDFEPSARTIADINSAEVFLFLGAGFDPWAEKIDDDLENQGVLTLRLTRFFSLVERKETEEVEESTLDPHIWLDPVHAQELVEIIRDVLQNADPANADVYADNAAAYNAQIAQLHDDYESALDTCALDTIVTSHDAFGYLGDRYGFGITPIAGLSPRQEPSPQDLARIATTAQEAGVGHILIEPLAADTFANTVRREIGAEFLTLHPIESITKAEQERGASYLSLMNDNLDALTIALRCEQ